MSRGYQITAAADCVHFVEGPAVNWTILYDAGEFTLVDAGYPGDEELIINSIRDIGLNLRQLAAIVVTHAHIDHVGAIPALLRGRDVPVLMSAQEVRHAKREYLEQATPQQVAARAWRPRTLRWSAHVLKSGGTRDIRIPSAASFEPGKPIAVPGRPVPIASPGHTSGHTCYHLPANRAVITGDALITGHPTSSTRGPQMIAAFFAHDAALNTDSVRKLAQLENTDTILPGHGPLWRGGSVAHAISSALGD